MHLSQIVFFATALLLLACSSLQIQKLSGNSEVRDSLEVEIPTGNEVVIEIKRLDRNNSLVTVKNVSKRDIFCACEVERTGNRERGFPIVVEFKEQAGKAFEFNAGYVDSAPGLEEIRPQEWAEIKINHQTSGEYRVKFAFLIDAGIRKLITEKIPTPGLNKLESEAVESAWYRVVTQPIKIPLERNT